MTSRPHDPRLARAAEVLEAALDLPPGERGAYLDQACGEDGALRTWVEGMLRADATGHAMLDAPPEQLLDMLAEDVGEVEGLRFGPWRVVQELGRGGMGVVYLAERADGEFRQLAALKVMRAGPGAEDLVERFHRERQILANLRHPHIAQLHDGGRTDEGIPYLAMEYVEGERLDRWCDAHQLSVEERIELFGTVCRAVQHAHQSLVIHRDLKPSNILVTNDGVVKLLDFGIAKLLPDPVSGGTEDDAITRTGVQAFTPQYSSPEQIRNQAVTTATDVYALGVILYELLSGRRPFSAGDDPFETARLALETDPAPPSLLATRGVEDGSVTSPSSLSAAEVAAHRGTTPGKLSRRLHGDLDAIVLKALHKDPGGRYQSVQTLIDDLERHRRNEPILARPQGAWYRIRRYGRRHRTAIIATAAVLLALSGGLAAALWEGHAAVRQRDLARAEASKSERVTAFLVDIFKSADPSEARGESLTAREILDRGARRVEHELASQPTVQATVQRSIGTIYMNLGLYEEARTLMDSSLAEHRRVLTPDDPEILDDLKAEAGLAFAAGGPADSLYELVLRLRRGRLGPNDPGVAAALDGLGLARTTTDPAGADSLFRQAAAIYRRAPDHEVDLAEVLNNLGLLEHHTGHYAEAESLYVESLGLERATLGVDHPQTLVTMSNLGWLYQLDGRFDAADSILSQTLEARRRILGSHHPLVAATLSGLGETAMARGAYDDAQEYFTEALSIRKEHLPAGKGNVGVNVLRLADAVAAQGRFAEARAMYAEAVQRLEDAYGPESTSVARAVNDRAELFEVHGDFSAAEREYRRAWGIYRKNMGNDHPFTAIIESNVANTLLKQDSLDAAEPLLNHALEVLRKAWSEDHPSVGPVLIELGSVQFRRGDLADAEVTLRKALANVTHNLPAGHWRIAEAQVRLGRCLDALGKRAEAEPLLKNAVSTLQPLPTHRDDYREALLGLEELYNALGRHTEAARYHTLLGSS